MSQVRQGKPTAQAWALNPSARMLGCVNAVVSGTAPRYHVGDYEGCLSIKSVSSGEATYRTPGRRFVLRSDTYLILNDRQQYSLDFESGESTSTFCIFFARGFVEDVLRGTSTSDASLVEAPDPAHPPEAGFFERLERSDDSVAHTLRMFSKKIQRQDVTQQNGGELFTRLAEALVREHHLGRERIARLPALRASTREELYRRLLRGRDLLLASPDEDISLSDVARAACLSPYHFHRSFTVAFGKTPHQYLTAHRLERAAQLLRRTPMSVTQICFDSGFESLGSFSSLFRRNFGTSPREFRNSAS